MTLQLPEQPGFGHLPAAHRELLQGSLRVAPPRISVSPENGTAAIQSEKWFFLLHLRDHGPDVPGLRKEAHTFELFDMTLDPGCEFDVSADHPEEAVLLHEALVGWLARPASQALGMPPHPTPDCTCDPCSRLR